jgi:hypothetical protein
LAATTPSTMSATTAPTAVAEGQRPPSRRAAAHDRARHPRQAGGLRNEGARAGPGAGGSPSERARRAKRRDVGSIDPIFPAPCDSQRSLPRRRLGGPRLRCMAARSQPAHGSPAASSWLLPHP